jgi:hypothetical protein
MEYAILKLIQLKLQRSRVHSFWVGGNKNKTTLTIYNENDKEKAIRILNQLNLKGTVSLEPESDNPKAIEILITNN